MKADLSAETVETIKVASNWMMHAVAEYITVHRLKPTDEQLGEITSRMKAAFPQVFAEARRDAKEALDCGMRDVATATFKGTFTVAAVVITRLVLNHA